MNTDKTDFTQGSILKKLSLFMLPVLGALVLQAAYGAVDLLVVGHFGSTAGLSAVSTGSQLLNLVTFVVTQLAMGVTVLIARYIGEKKPQQIGAVLGGAAVVFAIMSVVLFILLVAFARPIAVLTGIGVGLMFGCAVFALVMFRGDLLAGVFSTDAEVVQKGFEYLKGFAPETIVTAILFSMVGYFNGNNKTLWVMIQGLVQTLLVRLPMAYFMSIQPNASLTKIGLAAPVSTTVGVVLNIAFYMYLNRAEQRKQRTAA